MSASADDVPAQGESASAMASDEATASPEPLTDELLAQLLTSASPEAYLESVPAGEASLTDYAWQLLREKGLRRSEVIRASGINPTLCYQVFEGNRGLGRDNAIKLAFGLGCTLTEAQRLLRHAGHAELWCKLKRDAIVIFCLDHGYSRVECDDELYRLGEDTLLMADENE